MENVASLYTLLDCLEQVKTIKATSLPDNLHGGYLTDLERYKADYKEVIRNAKAATIALWRFCQTADEDWHDIYTFFTERLEEQKDIKAVRFDIDLIMQYHRDYYRSHTVGPRFKAHRELVRLIEEMF